MVWMWETSTLTRTPMIPGSSVIASLNKPNRRTALLASGRLGDFDASTHLRGIDLGANVPGLSEGGIGCDKERGRPGCGLVPSFASLLPPEVRRVGSMVWEVVDADPSGLSPRVESEDARVESVDRRMCVAFADGRRNARLPMSSGRLNWCG